ncbi:MAG TPA: hypothetical protein VKX16_18865 [Chloroflexota bacterium]|nr:hypothetical protein [Chloroflexota bacterium]
MKRIVSLVAMLVTVAATMSMSVAPGPASAAGASQSAPRIYHVHPIPGAPVGLFLSPGAHPYALHGHVVVAPDLGRMTTVTVTGFSGLRSRTYIVYFDDTYAGKLLLRDQSSKVSIKVPAGSSHFRVVIGGMLSHEAIVKILETDPISLPGS